VKIKNNQETIMSATTQIANIEKNNHSGNGDNRNPQNLSVPAYPVVNQSDILTQIQEQNFLSTVHQQFNQNQGKYIDLLSKIVDYQALMLDKYQDSAALPKAMHNFDQILQILQRNQLNYNINHEGYLQNQLNLIRTSELPTDISNKLDDVSLSKQLNTAISETQAVLPLSPKQELQSSLHSSASQSASNIPTPTEELPQVPSSNEFNYIPVSKEPNGSVPKTNIVDTVAATSPIVSTPPKPSLLQQVVITSKPTNDAVKSVSTPSIPSTSPEPINNSVESVSAPVHPQEDAPSTTVDLSGFSNRLLEVVSDKTGYPVDMLDLNMDLEADLGIDSIKQLEIFAAMHEEFPDMDVDPELFRDLRTLAKIVDYLQEHLSKNQATQISNNGNTDQHLGIERQVVKKKF
jgi:acyl carrier protein